MNHKVKLLTCRLCSCKRVLLCPLCVFRCVSALLYVSVCVLHIASGVQAYCVRFVFVVYVFSFFLSFFHFSLAFS